MVLAALLGLVAGCARPAPQRVDADVVVIGAGIAGLAAALEASAAGRRVAVVEMNSVGGGHAVMAGGLFLVGTPLQAARGVVDSPELALADLVAWGEDPEPAWARRYVEGSRREVHDWLAALGVEFTLLLPAPGETTVPRFHFARGGAANVVVPMLAAALARPGIRLLWNTQATGLRRAGGLWALDLRDTRTGQRNALTASAVIVATGGFENDLARVRANWRPGLEQPPRLLAGAGHNARGSGLDIARAAGAAVANLDRQTIFVTGIPNPRDPDGVDGLLAQNPAAVFVDRSGRRFIDEAAPRKALEEAVLRLPGQTWWMIFDARGKRRLQVRGAPWLTPATLEAEILDDPGSVQRACDLATLARAAGLPADVLGATIARFNAQVAAGADRDFGRFGPERGGAVPRALVEPPFFALRLYPMTRKSLGGLVIDDEARVLDPSGTPLPGLYAAGEATGVAGINGRHGGSGTFLGPSVFTGRIAGRGAAEAATGGSAARAAVVEVEPPPAALAAAPGAVAAAETAPNAAPGGPDRAALETLLALDRPGYWHFGAVHRLVMERSETCAGCHRDGWPVGPALDRAAQRVQLASCSRCH